MPEGRRSRGAEWSVTLPSLLWLIVLFLVPSLIVFAIAFKPATPYGGIGPGWTLDTIRSLGNPNYPVIVWRTVWLSVITTVACLLLSVPMGYYMARAPKRTLVALGVAGPDTQLLYNSWAVLLVLVYTELPFAILPIYAAAEKFDFRLIEAARDLGASPFRAFRSVFVPGIRRGIVTAMLVTFIPALGAYVVPDIVGGPSSEMIGNKIAQRTFVDRNLPEASALSALLALAVLLPTFGVLALNRGRDLLAPRPEDAP